MLKSMVRFFHFNLYIVLTDTTLDYLHACLCVVPSPLGIKNAEFYAGKAEDLLKDLMRTLPQDKEIIAILDPPRAGVRKSQ